MKTAITRAKVGVDLWIVISVLSVASSCPVDAADDLVVSVVAFCEAMLKEYVDRWTTRSPGLSPLRILPVYVPTNR